MEREMCQYLEYEYEEIEMVCKDFTDIGPYPQMCEYIAQQPPSSQSGL